MKDTGFLLALDSPRTAELVMNRTLSSLAARPSSLSIREFLRGPNVAAR
jgi:hypothetical protein